MKYDILYLIYSQNAFFPCKKKFFEPGYTYKNREENNRKNAESFHSYILQSMKFPLWIFSFRRFKEQNFQIFFCQYLPYFYSYPG